MDPTDPTRIPRVLAALERAWEGQPDLPLTTLMGILANRGIGWGASDEELLSALKVLEEEHPSLLDAHPPHHVAITTTNPAMSVTLRGNVVVVRGAANPSAMPSVWLYDSLRRTGPGRPLVIRDTDRIEHRLGVVGLVTRLGDPEPLDGRERDDVGEQRWLVVLDTGARALVGRRITVWTPSRRDVAMDSLAWEKFIHCAVGGPAVVAPAGGGGPHTLGVVERVVHLGAAG